MSPRPRTVPDERIIEATLQLVGARGVAALTLADIAAEVGLGPSTLLQRFGSKRGLLRAIAEQGVHHLPNLMRGAYESAADPLDGLRAAFTAGVASGMSPTEFAHHLGLLHTELADEGLRAVLDRIERAVRAEIESYLADAMAAGSVEPGDAEALAAAIAALRNGTQLSWAMTREGDLAAAMARDLDTLLGPRLTRKTGTAARPPVT